MLTTSTVRVQPSRAAARACACCAVLACCAFVAAAMEPLGYRVTMLAAVIFLMGAVERQRPFVVAPVALVLSFGSFSLIDQYLRVPLPRGFWGF